VRQVFASPRMENVERVAALLKDAGIETRTTHARSYKGGLRGDFSYLDHVRTDPIPAVWVVKSEDQPAAREILRAAGLLDSTRKETGYTLPVFRTEEPLAADDPARKRAFRLKAGLLLVISVVLVLAFLSQRGPASRQVAQRPAPTLPAGISATPDRLARAVLSGELPTREGQTVCLGIDGGDPSPSLRAALPAAAGTLQPLSKCAAAANVQTLLVRDFRWNGHTGTIVLERRRGARLLVSHTYDVRPVGSGWRVVEPYQ
jgi:hypothetical protein